MSEAKSPLPNSPYGWYVVGVLILAYTFSFIDRTILTLMVDPIRASLKISDFELSLLHGLAFALFYTFLGIPIGRLVDRRRRSTIIAIGVFFWSIMTALCGLSRTFGQMFIARVGVGVGEAALSPAAYSLLSDWFEGKKLVRALSLYQSAIYFGGGLATIVGGTLILLVPAIPDSPLGPLEPWQIVFFIVGLPGILVALWAYTLREPVRRGKVTADIPTFPVVLRYMREQWRAYGGLILGFAIASMMWNGVTAWAPTHFIRTFGWTAPEAGLRYGLTLMVCGTSGILTGGWLASFMRDKGSNDSNVKIGVISALLAMPVGIAAPLMPTDMSSLAMLGLFLFAGAMPYGGAAASFQEITPNRMRGQISAVYLFGLNLVGIGLGPTVVASVSDAIFASGAGISPAMAVVVGVCAPLSALTLWATRKPYRGAFEEFARSQ